MAIKKPKIVLWDIETSGIIATTWNLYPSHIDHSNLLQDWFIISGAWKVLGEKQVHAVSVLDAKKRKGLDDDYHVCKALREMLEDVDILIHHNGDKFDIKAFNWRLIYHGLPPLPPFQTVDTLKEIKKISRATSNRLDFLGKVFTGAGKKDTPPGTWLRAMQGDKEAISCMVKYNKVDVLKLEAVYNRILPYIKTHPHVGVLNGALREESCPKCGSTHIKHNGVRVSAAGLKKREIQCLDCHSYSRIPFK